MFTDDSVFDPSSNAQVRALNDLSVGVRCLKPLVMTKYNNS